MSQTNVASADLRDANLEGAHISGTNLEPENLVPEMSAPIRFALHATTRPAVIATLLAVAMFAATGCGDDTGADSQGAAGTTANAIPTTTGAAPTAAPPTATDAAPTPTAAAEEPSDDDDAVARLDRVEESANDALERLAKAGDRKALAAAERRLDRASRRADAARSAPADPAADPLQRLLATFPYKQAPLFVQQTTITGELDDHQLFVSVIEEQFCLKSDRRRLSAVRTVFKSVDRSMREGGATDLEFIVVPLIGTAPTVNDALAVGSGGSVRLTQRGRGC